MKRHLTTMLSVYCLVASTVHAADTADAQYIAELFFDAQSSSTHFPDVIRINPSLDESQLYDIQRRFVALQLKHGSSIGGYKGGFIPKAPVGGVLIAHGILHGAPTIDSADFQGLLVEAEIAFRLCHPVSTRVTGIATLKANTCGIYPAVELPDAAVANLDLLRQDFDHLRRLLIPTNVAVSHVLLGEGVESNSIDLDRLDVKVELDGAQIGFRDGATSTDNIWARLLWVINEFVIANGYTVTPHHVIIPGSLTGLHRGTPGSYRIDYGALGRVEFTVR